MKKVRKLRKLSLIQLSNLNQPVLPSLREVENYIFFSLNRYLSFCMSVDIWRGCEYNDLGHTYIPTNVIKCNS